MRGTAQCYDELRGYVETIPIIETHDHTHLCYPKYNTPMDLFVGGCLYLENDLISASTREERTILLDHDKSFDERWPVLEKVWPRTCHTGYAQVVKRVLKEYYNIEEVTYENLKGIEDKLLDLTVEKDFVANLDKANIVARITNVFHSPKDMVDRTLKIPPKSKMVINGSDYFYIMDRKRIDNAMRAYGRTVTSFDDFLEGCMETYRAYKDFGSPGFKGGGNAYIRTLETTCPTKGEAEKVFNKILQNPRCSLGWPDEARPLFDYLVHHQIRAADELDMIVQIHTGSLANNYNDITNANAIHLTPLLELYQNVQFDIFHANWPYSDELMFLGKNYPNVAVNLCWATHVDPIYCINFFKQSVSCMPHSKVLAYGGDYGGKTDRVWASSQMARDIVSIALSDLIEIEYLNMDDAKEIACAWFFDNPNRVYKLGLKRG